MRSPLDSHDLDPNIDVLAGTPRVVVETDEPASYHLTRSRPARRCWPVPSSAWCAVHPRPGHDADPALQAPGCRCVLA
ncbi:MAG: hypothetical protein R2854_23570 [Caldilineaceae bacterium]